MVCPGRAWERLGRQPDSVWRPLVRDYEHDGHFDAHDAPSDERDGHHDEHESNLDEHAGHFDKYDARLDEHGSYFDERDGNFDEHEGHFNEQGIYINKHVAHLATMSTTLTGSTTVSTGSDVRPRAWPAGRRGEERTNASAGVGMIDLMSHCSSSSNKGIRENHLRRRAKLGQAVLQYTFDDTVL
mmetsp:Transcript_175586/g.563113  ORF Transcript_175586/g.563113 Transcript_175586/m.563113 type:complete len:185 (-) Transcript_175586:419-973(-)